MYESSYHYLLMSNHLGFQKKVMAILKPLGLSTGQPKVLDHIFLTDYGMEQSESIEKAFLTLEHEVFSGISNTEKEQFLKTFEKLYQNITKEE